MDQPYHFRVEHLSTPQESALKCWLECCPSNSQALPGLTEFQNRCNPDTLGNSVLLRCHKRPTDFEYLSIGDRIVEQISKNFTGCRMSTLAGKGPGSRLWTFLERVQTTGIPDIDAVPYAGPNTNVSHTSLVALPFQDSSDGTSLILLEIAFEAWPFLKEESDLKQKVRSLRTFLQETITNADPGRSN